MFLLQVDRGEYLFAKSFSHMPFWVSLLHAFLGVGVVAPCLLGWGGRVPVVCVNVPARGLTDGFWVLLLSCLLGVTQS